jgi:hypothetical protein
MCPVIWRTVRYERWVVELIFKISTLLPTVTYSCVPLLFTLATPKLIILSTEKKTRVNHGSTKRIGSAYGHSFLPRFGPPLSRASSSAQGPWPRNLHNSYLRDLTRLAAGALSRCSDSSLWATVQSHDPLSTLPTRRYHDRRWHCCSR